MLLTEQAARLQGGDWAPFFAAECAKPYFAALDAFVTEAAAHTTVYPAAENIFAAFSAQERIVFNVSRLRSKYRTSCSPSTFPVALAASWLSSFVFV